MSRSLKIFILLVILAMFAGKVYGDSSYKELELTPVRPKTLQGEAMRADSVRGRPVYSSETKDLWIMGEVNLWKWNLEQGFVSRMAFPKQVRTPFRMLVSEGRKLWGVDDRALWILDQGDLGWTRLKHEFKEECLADPLSLVKLPSSASYFMLSPCGGYVINPMTHQVDFNPFKMQNPEQVHGLASGKDSRGEFVVFNQKRRIVRKRLGTPPIAGDVVYVSKFDLKGVVSTGSNFFVWTDKALLVFDQQLKRQKVVPVVGQRKIASFGVSERHHALVFDDGTMELMAINSQKKWFGRDLPKATQTIDFIENGHYMVVSEVHGEPQVFRVTPD